MRNTYIILTLAVMFVPGCKSGPTGISDSKNTGIWSKQFRTKFIQDCIGEASATVSASEAFTFCTCIADKVEAKYPDETGIETKLSDADISDLKKECLPGETENTVNTNSWSEADQQEFLNNCPATVNKTLGTSAANDYCDCMLKKLMQEYPDVKDIDKASKAHLNVLASGCLVK